MEQMKNQAKPTNALEFKKMNLQRAREAYFKAKAEGKLRTVVFEKTLPKA